MASTTTFMRLEPRIRNADMKTGLQARVYDPLWMLARQWQFGEYQAEDNGSPAIARWRGEVSRLSRYYAGPVNGTVEGQRFNGDAMPLETLVERERARPDPTHLEKLRFAAEAGHQFLRMLEQQTTSKSYRDAFKAKFPFAPLSSDERSELDPDALSFLELVMPRVPDGRKLYDTLSASLRPPGGLRGSLPADVTIAAADVAEVTLAALWWLQWYEGLISEPDGNNAAWSPERMEYAFSVGARMSSGEKVLTAQEYYSGHTDWHDFNLNPGASLRGDLDPPSSIVTQTLIPAPVSYKGMPAERFWEFEDSQVDFGAVNAGPEDLARMLLVEFAISFGNDWFVIPVELPVGSLSRTSSLVITNTFGERYIVRSSNDVGMQYSAWRMFQLTAPASFSTSLVDPTNANLFLLPPALVKTIESRPIEEVLFLRDEMANMAWGVERIIESTTERPINRFEQQRYVVPPSNEQTGDSLVYRLATDVPDYWIPLLPVQSDQGLRLRRGMVLKADGTQELVGARGRILVPDPVSGDGLAIFEEEIPREGIRVTRNYQLTRWQDGSTHLWIGRRKVVGSGEGSSGLQFDTAKPGPTTAPADDGAPII